MIFLTPIFLSQKGCFFIPQKKDILKNRCKILLFGVTLKMNMQLIFENKSAQKR